jgi:hypothetical protein
VKPDEPQFEEIAELKDIHLELGRTSEDNFFLLSGLKPVGEFSATINFNNMIDEAVVKLTEVMSQLCESGRLAASSLTLVRERLSLLDAMMETNPLYAPRYVKKAIKKLNDGRRCTWRQRVAVQRWIDRANKIWHNHGLLVASLPRQADDPVVPVFHASREDGWLPKV